MYPPIGYRPPEVTRPAEVSRLVIEISACRGWLVPVFLFPVIALSRLN